MNNNGPSKLTMYMGLAANAPIHPENAPAPIHRAKLKFPSLSRVSFISFNTE